MKTKKSLLRLFVVVCAVIFSAQVIYAEAEAVIKLTAPKMDGGMPLMQALKERKSEREFSDKPLSVEMLSNLLWAANGISRPDSGKRTAPTAMNCQEIDIYVAMKDGLYFYDAKKNELILVLKDDIRAATGMQDFVADAPVNLIFVLDRKKGEKLGEHTEFYGATDTGYISQNVYLFCASEGLNTVVRGWFDGEVLGKAMNLRADQKVILTQTVGYKK